MRRFLPFLAFLLVLFPAFSQTHATLEEFELEAGTYLNGSDGNGGFSSGNVFLPNAYNDEFDFWSGWAISNQTDNITPGFLNQYSAIPGEGALGSANYALSYAGDISVLHLVGDAAGGLMQGIYITNSTYAYLSMLEGDDFAKRFGGETGDDPDFFLLTIKAWNADVLSADSVDFYLADFRYEDNSEDYIVNEWTYVELASLGPADSLKFTLTSSDVGDFGMNTPGYFCADDIITADGLIISTNRPELGPSLALFPNPATEYLTLTWPETGEAIMTIADMQGRTLGQQQVLPGDNRFALQGMPSGTYIATIRYEHERRSSLFVVK